ncbi:hypothetical protein PQI51_11050 [Microbacterium esteraromaticum]|uniref:hypothetical protein n=1 Tax=Microbacterium esteraromaticum TaxID=57043 RepID=UPI0030B00B86
MVEINQEAVVVPLVNTDAEMTTEAMLRMLMNREALLLSDAPAREGSTNAGMLAPATGAFAKAVGQALGNMSHARAGQGLYRAILPTGAVARELVPAVGGGFRGLVRSAGSTKIGGHVRLVPAVAGAGATAAAGPLIATVGLAVAGEMLAQHQMNKKLDSIKSAVVEMSVRMDDADRAVLTTASNQASKVSGYLLDQARIPSISSAAHAFGELDALTNTYIDRLDRWTDAVALHGVKGRVNTHDLLLDLVGKREGPARAFEQIVARTYEALALRARVVVLEKIAAEFSNPDRSLGHVERALRNELSSLADRQTQLVSLLDDLNVLQMDSSRLPVAYAGKGTISMRTSFGRLSKALHSAPESIPVLSDSDQMVLELAPSASGLTVVTPAP